MQHILASSIQKFEPEAIALFAKGIALGGGQPSQANKTLINKYIKALKATANGTLNGYYGIHIYNNDIAGSGLIPFDSIKWNNPEATRITRGSSDVYKTAKKGYSSGPSTLASFLDTNTIINTELTEYKEDIGVIWFFSDLVNTGLTRTGIIINTESRAVACYPKYGTDAYLLMGGRSFGFPIADGDQSIGGECVGGNVTAFANLTQVASNTTNHQQSFNSSFIDLNININPAQPSGPGTTALTVGVKIAASIIYKPSIVSRVGIINGWIEYCAGLATI